MLPSILALLVAASPALEEAKGHLKAGKVDDVYFALDGKPLPEEDRAEGARVLCEAGKKALEKKDGVMALQLAKMATKTKADFAPALELASRASRALEQFTDAEKLADDWLEAEPQSPEANVWRAELAIDAGDWDKALGALDQAKAAKGPLASKAKQLRDRAQKEQASKQSGLSTLRQLERELAKAQAERKAEPDSDRWARAEPSGGGGIVLYSTAWCPYCTKARNWFKARGVPFVEKDVEKSPDAAKELAAKAARSGTDVRGVPVIDVKGTLVAGFDVPRLEELLRN